MANAGTLLMRRLAPALAAAGLAVAVTGVGTVRADPPPWAPAWGHHKHDREHEHSREYEHSREHEHSREYEHSREHEHSRDYKRYREHEQRRYSRDDDDAGGAVAYRSDYIHNGRCNREALGSVVGAVVGGAAGSRIGKGNGRVAATVIGAIVGYMVGGTVGRSMDAGDRACVGQALEYSAPNQPVAWRNPDSGVDYRITPRRTYRSDGRYCREFTRQALIGGRTQTVYGTACRQADGSWKIQP
ncbi:MAG: RT0821/Lpp0805 family surface protein [Gammaproteobacteria bacterium]